MGKLINNKKTNRIAILIIWILTIVLLIFRTAFELRNCEVEIGYATPVYVELTDEEIEDLKKSEETVESIVAQIKPDDEEKQDSNLLSRIELLYFKAYPRSLEALKVLRIILILKLVLAPIYLVGGIVGFIILRRKGKETIRIFTVLALINVAVLILTPFFIASSPYSIRHITNA